MHNFKWHNLIWLKEKQLAKAKDFGKPKFIW